MNLPEFSKHTLMGCALRLLDYTENVNPKARITYNAISSRKIQGILKSYKVKNYDAPSTHLTSTVDQEVNFAILLTHAIAECEESHERTN